MFCFQVDSLGKLDPEVEDLLLEIADDFIESVSLFKKTLISDSRHSSRHPSIILIRA